MSCAVQSRSTSLLSITQCLWQGSLCIHIINIHDLCYPLIICYIPCSTQLYQYSWLVRPNHNRIWRHAYSRLLLSPISSLRCVTPPPWAGVPPPALEWIPCGLDPVMGSGSSLEAVVVRTEAEEAWIQLRAEAVASEASSLERGLASFQVAAADREYAFLYTTHTAKILKKISNTEWPHKGMNRQTVINLNWMF